MSQHGQLTPATGVLTFEANAAATDEVTIGNITYTYVASNPDPSAFELVPGSDADETVEELAGAINGEVEGMPQNPYVSAEFDAGDDTVTVTARVGGALGNGIATTTSEVDITFAAATLAGGEGRMDTVISEILTVGGPAPNSHVASQLRRLTPAAD